MKGKEGDSGSTSKDNENSLECNGLFFSPALSVHEIASLYAIV